MLAKKSWPCRSRAALPPFWPMVAKNSGPYFARTASPPRRAFSVPARGPRRLVGRWGCGGCWDGSGSFRSVAGVASADLLRCAIERLLCGREVGRAWGDSHCSHWTHDRETSLLVHTTPHDPARTLYDPAMTLL